MKLSHSLLAVMLSFLAASTSYAQDQNLPRFKPYAAQTVSPDRSELVLIRQKTNEAGAVTVFLGGEYHTSLAPGAYTSICLAAGPVETQINYVRTGAVDSPVNQSAVLLKPGVTTYANVVDLGRNRFAIREVSSAQARELLTSVDKQPHTISRVSRAIACYDPTVVAKAPTPAVPARFNFSGDTLFAFGKSGVGDLTSAGRASLDQFADSLTRAFASLDRVTITGYADPIGRADLNQRLSEARAASVSSYLMSRGVNRSVITSVGLGSSDLVAQNCPRVASPASVACNAPNRRVVVDVVGVRN
jgi:OOP family OmpA-OmpF porin